MFGTNDSVGGTAGLQKFVENYVEVVTRARDAGVGLVVIQTAVPMLLVNPDALIELAHYADKRTRDSKLNGLRMRLEHLPAYAEAAREAARQLNAPLIDHWSVWEAVGGARGQLLDGGFHPNEYGHRLIAHTIFRVCGIWNEKGWTCRLFVPI